MCHTQDDGIHDKSCTHRNNLNNICCYHIHRSECLHIWCIFRLAIHSPIHRWNSVVYRDHHRKDNFQGNHLYIHSACRDSISIHLEGKRCMNLSWRVCNDQTHNCRIAKRWVQYRSNNDQCKASKCLFLYWHMWKEDIQHSNFPQSPLWPPDIPNTNWSRHLNRIHPSILCKSLSILQEDNLCMASKFNN